MHPDADLDDNVTSAIIANTLILAELDRLELSGEAVDGLRQPAVLLDVLEAVGEVH